MQFEGHCLDLFWSALKKYREICLHFPEGYLSAQNERVPRAYKCNDFFPGLSPVLFNFSHPPTD